MCTKESDLALLKDPDMQAVVLYVKRFRRCRQAFLSACLYAWSCIYAITHSCWNCVAWLTVRSWPALLILGLSYGGFAGATAYVSSIKNPLVLTFPIDDIVVVQTERAVEINEAGERTRIVSLFALKHADTKIVKRWFEEYGYDVREETYIESDLYQKNNRRREQVRRNDYARDRLTVYGRPPPLEELRIDGSGKVTVHFDPEHVVPADRMPDRSSLKHSMENLAHRLRYGSED